MAFNATTASDIDTEEDIISLEEVQTWSLDALKDFCKKRGYKVTGSKKELMARVYVLYNISVSEQRGAKQQEASRKADYKSLVNCRFSAPFPIISVVFITSENHEQIFVLLRLIKDALTSKIIFFCTSSRWVTSLSSVTTSPT